MTEVYSPGSMGVSSPDSSFAHRPQPSALRGPGPRLHPVCTPTTAHTSTPNQASCSGLTEMMDAPAQM